MEKESGVCKGVAGASGACMGVLGWNLRRPCGMVLYRGPELKR
jgi:hypothetical protein